MKRNIAIIVLTISMVACLAGCSSDFSKSDNKSSFEDATEYYAGNMSYYVDNDWSITYQDSKQTLFNSSSQDGALRVECENSYSDSPQRYIKSSWPETATRKVTAGDDLHNYGGADFATATINYIGENTNTEMLACAIVDGQAYVVMYSAPLTQSAEDSPYSRTVASISFS